MLTYIAAKFLLKGVVKSLIINPAISASLSIIPREKVVNYSLLGQNLSLSTKDLIKFGFEKLYQAYGEHHLEFTLEKFQNTLYRIYPANELAARFFKEYTDVDELIFDLDTVDKYLDILVKEDLQRIDELETSIFEQDEAILQMLHDFDLAVERSSKDHFDSPAKEQELIDQVMQKNMNMVSDSVRRIKREKELRKAGKEFDLPKVPYKPKSDTEKIDDILNKISNQLERNQRTRSKVSG